MRAPPIPFDATKQFRTLAPLCPSDMRGDERFDRIMPNVRPVIPDAASDARSPRVQIPVGEPNGFAPNDDPQRVCKYAQSR